MRRNILLACGVLASACAPQREPEYAGEPLAFIGVSVVDVESGRVIPDQTVLIVGRHIRLVEAADSVDVPKDARRVDARGRYLIPGLWDTHVHLTPFGESVMLLFVPYGLGLTWFTTTMQLLFCLGFFFLFQVPISHWWLARYQYGPAEWLWRSATYGAAQPMRRPPVPVADVTDSMLFTADGAELR